MPESGLQAVPAQVREVRVVQDVDLLHHEAAQVALHRDREGGVLGVQDQERGEAEALVLQPVLQTRGLGPGADGAAAEVHVEGRGGQHHGAALHQELVDGELLLAVQVLWAEHQQQVRVLRHLARAEVRIAQLDALAQALLEQVVGRRPGRPTEGIGGGGRRRVDGQGPQQAGGEALDAGLDGALEPGLVQGLGQGHRHRLVAGLQHQVEVEGLGVQQAEDQGLEAEALGDLLGQGRIGSGSWTLKLKRPLDRDSRSFRMASRSALRAGRGSGRSAGSEM